MASFVDPTVEPGANPLPIREFIPAADAVSEYRAYADKVKAGEAGPIAFARCGAEKVMPLGLPQMLFFCYNSHFPLRLRPDDVWRTILGQFALHVTANAEALHKHFVDFEGKEKIEVVVEGFTQSEVEHFARTAVAKARAKIVDPADADMLMPSFSTTTDLDRTVMAMMTMAVLKSYFDWGMVEQCGFPEIDLLGTEADWGQLLACARHLRKFASDQVVYTYKERTIPPGFEGAERIAEELHNEKRKSLHNRPVLLIWLDLLERVLQKMLACKRGENDPEFWQTCIKITPYGSGSATRLSGWITVFGAFDTAGNFQGTNYLEQVSLFIPPGKWVEQPLTWADRLWRWLGYRVEPLRKYVPDEQFEKRSDEERARDHISPWFLLDSIMDIPSGMVHCDCDYTPLGYPPQTFMLIAGTVGCEVFEGRALQSVAGWAVSERRSKA